MSYKSTEDAANAILKILGEEEQELAAVLKIEKTERRPKSNRMMVSLKKGGQTFRITLDWIRDEHMPITAFIWAMDTLKKAATRMDAAKRRAPAII